MSAYIVLSFHYSVSKLLYLLLLCSLFLLFIGGIAAQAKPATLVAPMLTLQIHRLIKG